ncbi:hypothetical protein L7F22_036663 [Adiantum nelumboides]|nr:hypothetical protein [Adiantum nelumboides]
MVDNNRENRMSIDDFDFAHEDAIDDTPLLVNYLVTRLQQAMGNPALQGEVQQQLHAYGILPPPQQERDPEKSHGETSKRGLSTAREVENPYHELKQLLEGRPSSKKKGHVQHEGSPSKKREGSKSQDESMEDVAPRRRRAQRSPTPTKRKRSPHSPHRRESKREEKSSRKKKERKRLPSFPTSSPLPLLTKVAGILLKKSKGEDTEGTRNQLIADWAENIVANADFAAISHRNRLKITLQLSRAEGIVPTLGILTCRSGSTVILPKLAQKPVNSEMDSVISVHLTSSKSMVGIPGVASYLRQQRQGRDVFILGSANVGKSAFVSAMLKELSKRDYAATAALRRLPIQSAMPGTTLGPIEIKDFSSGGVHFSRGC